MKRKGKINIDLAVLPSVKDGIPEEEDISDN